MQHNPLEHLLRLEARLAALLRAHEARAPMAQQPKPPQLAPGHRLLVRPYAESVHDPRVVVSAFSQWLFVRNYLARRKPTGALLKRLAHRLRGLLLWQSALTRAERGEPLPLKGGMTRRDVPAWALRAADRATKKATRASSSDGGSGSGGNPLDWWDAYGLETSLTAEEIAALRDVIDIRQFRALVAGDLGEIDSLESGIEGLQALGYSDLRIAQLLQAAWNGQATLLAGQDLYDAAGIGGVGGVFDIVDPYFLDYLRNQAGYLITRIDETTRLTTADMLWRLQGGLEGVDAVSWSAVARALRQWSTGLGNDLADMSSYRAYMIAVTEIARAETFGSFVSMWTMGVKQKIWIVNAGACQICVSNAEAGAIDLLESFPSGVVAPPAHPKCRCGVGAALSDTFDPTQWQPRSAAAFDGALFNSDYGYWPDVEFPVDMLEEGRAQKARRLQPLSAPIDWPLAQRLRQVADTAATQWLKDAQMAMPTSETAIRTLSGKPRGDFAAADERYWQRLSEGLKAAILATRERHG